jgi:hypothetical protein
MNHSRSAPSITNAKILMDGLIMILLSIKDEVLPGEKAPLGDAGPQRLRNARENASSLTRQHLLAIEVAAIRQRRESG